MKKRDDPVPFWVYCVLIVVISFLACRYGWKVYGLSQCNGNVIVNQVVVEDGLVTVQGSTPMKSSMGGFIGTTCKQEGKKLTIGVKYNSFLGVLPTDKSTFSYQYKVDGEIDTVALQGSGQETVIWCSDEIKNEQMTVVVEISGVLMDALGFTCFMQGEKIAAGDITLSNAGDFSIPLVFMKSDFPENADMNEFELAFELKGENQNIVVPGKICPGASWGESAYIVIAADGENVTMRLAE